MGGNSPSHLSQDDGEGGGVVFVQGIRLSDRVINRMKRSPPPQKERPPSHSPDTQTANPVPAPSVEQLLPLLTPPTPPPIIPTNPASPQEAPSTPPSVEPVKLVPPPPVKFHSLPPSSVTTPPPVETKTPPQTNSTSPHATSTPSHAEPASSPLPEVVLPPPEPFVPPESPSTPPAAEHAASSPPPVETAPSEPLASSVPSDHEKPAAVEPATVAPAVPSIPSVPALHPPPTVKSTAAEPIIPPCPVNSAPVEALPPQAEPTGPPAVAPAVDSPPPCELVSAPPPPEPSHAPDLTFEESSLPCHSVELAVIPADAPADEPIIEPVAPPPPGPIPPAVKPILTPPLPPVEEEAVIVLQSSAALPVSPEVLEENLRLKIKEEMQRSLEEEINQKRQELQRQLEEVRARAQAEAKAAAQAQVEEQVKKILAAEKAAYMEHLTDSITKERMKTEDENLLVQLYWMELKAHQLEEKEKELKKRDTLYKEHVAKLEAKCTQFYKVTAESFQKGKEETHNRFARFNMQPVCGDLQSQILKCYQENTGRTLSCSKIASAYMQCVDNAKKNKLSTGG